MTTSVSGIFAAISRLTRVALGIAMMPALSTLAAHPANMGHVVPAQSPNWAGFLTQSPRDGIQGAYGNWVVPSVSCPSGATTSSSLWVGVGGDTTGSYEAGSVESLYQGGTSQDCDNGKASYYAWTEEADGVSPELVRKGAQVVAHLVEPGDVIAATVVQHELETLVTVQDVRRGQVAWKTRRPFYLTEFQHEEAGRTAECIMEASLIPGRGEAPLADFGTAHFSYCQASDDVGRVYNFDGPAAPSNWEPVDITMTINAQAIATPDPSLLSVSYTSLPAGPPGYAPQTPYCMPSELRLLRPGQRATVVSAWANTGQLTGLGLRLTCSASPTQARCRSATATPFGYSQPQPGSIAISHLKICASCALDLSLAPKLWRSVSQEVHIAVRSPRSMRILQRPSGT